MTDPLRKIDGKQALSQSIAHHKKHSYPATPELDKMKGVQSKSQAIGEFLDIFLAKKGVTLCQRHAHGPNCHGWDHERNRYNPRGFDRCDFNADELLIVAESIIKLIHIDT